MGQEQPLLCINDDRNGVAGRTLTDKQLCADWQHESPDAVAFTPFHVKGVRRDFIAGKTRDGSGDSSHGVRGPNGAVIGGASSIEH